MIKKISFFIFKGGFAFFILVIIYLLLSLILSSIPLNNTVESKKEIVIYIKTNGVHTDIVVPIKNELIDWSSYIKWQHTLSKKCNEAQFISMGWGDRGFYLETPEWKDLKFKTALVASSGIGKTAMHTTFYHNMIENEDCRKIFLSKQQYLLLISYLKDSFKVDNKNNFIPIKTTAFYGKNDCFYEAKGSYSIFKTCNTWANNALKVSDQKCCLWTPFDFPIFNKY